MADTRVWRLRTIWEIVLVCLCVQFISAENLTYGYQTVNISYMDRYQTEYKTSTSSMNWWEAAQSGCAQFDGELFTLKSQSLPLGVSSILQEGSYWIGAIEFAEWRWTDGSSLYTYEGYRQLLRDASGKNISGNSALSCHHHCGEWSQWFGLQDDLCYCLDSLDHVSKNKNTEVRCTGNYDERCGDRHGMSVYSIIHLIHMPYDPYNCGYVKWFEGPLYSELRFYLSPVCDSGYRKCAACNITDHVTNHLCSEDSHICISSRPQSWEESNEQCSLLKVTPNVENQLIQKITKDPTRFHCNGYWIGLRKTSKRSWIDGRKVNISYHEFDVSTFPRCLVIHVFPGSVRIYWTSCSSKHKILCETRKPKATTTALHSQTTTTTSSSISPKETRTTQWASTQKHITTSIQKDNVSIHYRDSQHGGQEDRDLTGVYIGSCFAALVLLAVLLLTIVLYRQDRFCFKTGKNCESRRNPVPSFSLPSENNTLSCLQGTGYQNSTQSVPSSGANTLPVATVRPIIQTTSFQSENTSDYRIVPLKVSVGSKITNSDMTKDIDTESHYEVPVSVKEDNSSDRIAIASGDPAYDFVGGGTAEGESKMYSLAIQTRDLEGTYKLAGATVDNISYTRDSAQCHDPSPCTYDVSGSNLSKIRHQNHTAAYNHVGISSPENIYDTIGQTHSDQLTDCAYDHVGGGELKPCSSMENNYDTTRHWQQVGPEKCTGINYSHTSEFRVDEATAGDEEEDTENIYHDIDDYHIG